MAERTQGSTYSMFPTRAELSSRASSWIRFLRQYGPVPQNENMYDEFIRRSAQRAGIDPLSFDLPASDEVLSSLTGPMPTSVVLTGTAGDGKTHLCRQVWESVGGDLDVWQSPEPYLCIPLASRSVDQGGSDGHPPMLHIIRDLSAWVPQRGGRWDTAKEELLKRFSASLFVQQSSPTEVFLIAGNDGQLVESWRRLSGSEPVKRALDTIEVFLVEDRRELEGVNLRFFNLSRRSSADLLDKALEAFLGHAGWDMCRGLEAGLGEFFGPDCPIRRNFELLQTEQVRERLRDLFSLCDHNRLHLPIRQILLLLVNAVLGHSDARDGLMTAEDVPLVIRQGSIGKASLYNNVFGGNLSEERRETILVFDALERLGIGYETTNRVDNILIFGDTDEALRPYYSRYLAGDAFYGADSSYRAAQREYIEGAAQDEERGGTFLRMLIAQRRALFFRVPQSEADEMRLWELSVFRYAGEYLEKVVRRLQLGRHVERPILSRLIRGLNRVFTGMLVSDDRELLLATSLALSQGRVSRLLEERVSVEPRLGERVEIVGGRDGGVPVLEVAVSRRIRRAWPLYVTRYEFLSRVAEGALPSSFSRECYEDLLAFKSQLLAALEERRRADREGDERKFISFRLLELEETGKATYHDLELREV